MKNLVKWQVISFMSRGVAMAIGLIQSFVILRILSVAEWGIVQIAVSIGGAFGIYQHLGLASGSTREISAAKDDTEIFKIFITSILIRYCVTVPIAIFLFFGASHIAITQYDQPALILPIKIYALVLLFQGVQSMFNSVISGTRRFKQLFIYQSAIAFVSVSLYIPLVYLYNINGYFFALFLFNLVASTTLSIIAFRPLECRFALPTKQDFKVLLKDLLSISLAIYAVKVIYTWWEKSGPLLLGRVVSAEMVGLFSFALLYGKKLMMVSDSVTDVNLPVLSEKYTKDIASFKNLFSANFDKIFAFIVFAAISAIYWSSEIIHIGVGSTKYDSAFPLILPMVFAFLFYSFINIVKSSIIIPAKMSLTMIGGFGVLLVSTIVGYFGLRPWVGHLSGMVYGMFIGSFLGFLFLTLVSQHKLEFNFFKHDHALLLLQGLAISFFAPVNGLLLKMFLYIVVVALYIWALFIAAFLDKEDVAFVQNRILTLKRRFVH